MTQSSDLIHDRIFRVRGLRVILDVDLAQLYDVPNKRLNEQVRRNREKFPEDFCFQLSRDEVANLKSQFATSSSGHGGVRKLPWVFSEHGALMAANILRSVRATKMAIYVVRAFVKQREAIATNTAILKRLAEVDKTLLNTTPRCRYFGKNCNHCLPHLLPIVPSGKLDSIREPAIQVENIPTQISMSCRDAPHLSDVACRMRGCSAPNARHRIRVACSSRRAH